MNFEDNNDSKMRLDLLVKTVEEHGIQSIPDDSIEELTNLIKLHLVTPKTVRMLAEMSLKDFLKLSLEGVMENTIKTFQNCTNKNEL